MFLNSLVLFFKSMALASIGDGSTCLFCQMLEWYPSFSMHNGLNFSPLPTRNTFTFRNFCMHKTSLNFFMSLF